MSSKDNQARELRTRYQVAPRFGEISGSVLPEMLRSVFIRRLFLLFLVAMVIPIYEFPGVGLSITAPLMFFIALEVLLRHRFTSSQALGNQWKGPLFIVAYGMLISVCASLLLGRVAPGVDIVVTLLRYSYWWLTFLIIANLSSHKAWMHYIILVLGVSVILLAGIRVVDAWRVGGWELRIAETRPAFLAKNLYGIQFSTYAPFAFILPATAGGKKRLLGFIGAAFVLLVVLANGSRGNWVALAVGSSVAVATYIKAHSRKGRMIFALLLLMLVIIFWMPLPSSIRDIVSLQLDTFENLDADKSYAFRQVMIQKGLILFEKHPVFGVGLNQFKRINVPELDIPPILQRFSSSFITGSPHNSYIHYLAELGLVGTIPFALLLAKLTFQGTQSATLFTRKEEVWALSVLWSLVSMSVHLWSFSGLGSTGPWFIYGLVAGTIAQGHDRMGSVNGAPVRLRRIRF